MKEIEIISIASTGSGCGFIEEKSFKTPYFIPFSAPGDVISIKNEKKHKKYVEAKIDKIVKPSKNRIEVKCPYFKKCGGCNLLHINYEAQLDEKKQILEHVLKRNNIEHPDINVIGCKDNKNYRYKSKIFVTSTDDRSYCGFKIKKTNDVIEVNSCEVVHKKIANFIKKYNEANLCRARDFQIIATVDYDTEKLSIKAQCKKTEIMDWIKNNCDYLNDDNEMSYKTNEFKIKYNNGSFIQSNLKQNQVLFSLIEEQIDKNYNVVFDLYGGNGNIAIPLSKKVKELFCVEHSAQALVMMMKNCEENKITNVECRDQDVLEFLDKNAILPDCIILDPPRIGCDEKVIEHIIKLNPEKIIYVSCNPIALKNDLKPLLNTYQISKLNIIDMFAHTEHMEVVCVLKKK